MAQVQMNSKKQQDQRRMAEVLKILKREYPESQCSLYYNSPFQLLIATILSAQCTDERVNQVTPHLFKKYPNAEAMAKAETRDLEKIIQSTGFFRSKAKALSESSREIVEKYGGEVPRDLDQLIRLRGVGRKTANVVLGNAFGVPGLVVDTHVKRLTYRLGFTQSTDPEKIEQQMMQLIPKEDWTIFAHLLIDHGRKVCSARKPQCDDCTLNRYCPKVGVV